MAHHRRKRLAEEPIISASETGRTPRYFLKLGEFLHARASSANGVLFYMPGERVIINPPVDLDDGAKVKIRANAAIPKPA
jgi:hypothetical protein